MVVSVAPVELDAIAGVAQTDSVRVDSHVARDVGADVVARDHVVRGGRRRWTRTPLPPLAEITLRAAGVVPPTMLLESADQLDAVAGVPEGKLAGRVGADEVARDQRCSRRVGDGRWLWTRTPTPVLPEITFARPGDRTAHGVTRGVEDLDAAAEVPQRHAAGAVGADQVPLDQVARGARGRCARPGDLDAQAGYCPR